MALYSNQREKGSIFDFGVHKKIRIHLLFQYDKTPCHLKEGTSIKKTADKTTRKVNKNPHRSILDTKIKSNYISVLQIHLVLRDSVKKILLKIKMILLSKCLS